MKTYVIRYSFPDASTAEEWDVPIPGVGDYVFVQAKDVHGDSRLRMGKVAKRVFEGTEVRIELADI